MIKGSISKWLTGVAACGLAVGAVAAPFSVKYSDTVSNSSVAAIPNGQQVTVELILDNGGSSTASQSWAAANLRLVCFTFNNDPTKFASINYAGSPLSAGPETAVVGSFTTNGSGQLQTGTIDWEDFRSPFTAPNLTNIAGVTAVTDWFIDHLNHVIAFGAAGQLGFTNVINDDQVTNWSNPVSSTGSCSGGSGGPGPTTTNLGSSLNPSTFGQSVTFTATVNGSSPTGTAQFKDGAGNLGSAVALSAGVATLSTSALTVGTHSITIVYSGDATNAGSTSPAVNQVVNAGVVTPAANIPTLSEWALVLLIGLMLAVGAADVRGRYRR